MHGTQIVKILRFVHTKWHRSYSSCQLIATISFLIAAKLPEEHADRSRTELRLKIQILRSSNICSCSLTLQINNKHPRVYIAIVTHSTHHHHHYLSKVQTQNQNSLCSKMAGSGTFAEIIDGDVFNYYADGKWSKSSSGKSVPIINPTTRKTHFKVQGTQKSRT